MLAFMDLMTLIGLVLLRFGLPLAVVGVAAYFLKRLDARWEAELGATAEQEAREAEQPAIAPALPARPARRRAPAPGPLPAFIPPPAVPINPQQGLQPGMIAAAAPPCWDVKGCTEGAKASCAAPQNAGVPCWQARLDAEGSIPEECVECEVFQRYPTM